MLLTLALLACTDDGKDSGDTVDTGEPCTELTWGADADGDGYGNPDFTQSACEAPSGYVEDLTDCDDGDADVHPGIESGFADADADGYGDPDTPADACDETGVENFDDCDDSSDAVNPDAEEVCGDGIDNDCSADSSECDLLGEVALGDAWTIVTGNAGDQLGGPVRALGEWNGNVAFAAAARGDDSNGDGAGAVHVFNAVENAGMTTSNAQATYTGGAAGSGLFAVWPAGGDATGDGSDDLIVSSRVDEAVYLHPYGGTGTIDATTGITLTGTEGNVDFGVLARVGDLNGDGFADLVVNAQKADSKTGATWVFHGPMTASGNDTDLGVKLTGANLNDQAAGLAGVGDLDGDGLPDFAVGAPFADGSGTDSGAVYVILNDGSGGGALVDNAEAILWGSDGDQAGWGIAGAGDHDGDGLDDLLVGVQRDDATTDNANEGAVYLVTDVGSGEGDLETLASVRMLGDAVDDRISNSAGGDANGDGNPDVIIGTRLNDEGGADAGSAYLFYGPMTAGTVSVGNADVQVVGSNAGDGLGAPAGFAGDVDGDGTNDLILGARWNDNGGEDAGRAYILLGQGI
jgi:hypothetical protein